MIRDAAEDVSKPGTRARMVQLGSNDRRANVGAHAINRAGPTQQACRTLLIKGGSSIITSQRFNEPEKAWARNRPAPILNGDMAAGRRVALFRILS